MVRPEPEKWGQNVEDLRRLAVESKHLRTRERFLALYMIATRATNATEWARQTGRSDEAVLKWVRRYNQDGPEALRYRRTGGRAPFLRRKTRRKSSRPSSRANPTRSDCLAGVGR